MSFESFDSYKMFSHVTRHRNRYIHDKKVISFLDAVLVTSKEREKTFKKGVALWRAQLGHGTDSRPAFPGDDDNLYENPCPHTQKRMKPLLNLATEGRANPKGIPYLYLATERKTAMCEVRPWVGSSISIAQFQINKDLRIIDCSKFAGNKFSHMKNKGFPVDDQNKLAVWIDIDNAFSEPISTSDQTSDYVPTQIIAELFKSKGFDGIAFKSSLSTTGFNVVLFDLDVADLIHCCLDEVESVEFKFKPADTPFGSYCIDESIISEI